MMREYLMEPPPPPDPTGQHPLPWSVRQTTVPGYGGPDRVWMVVDDRGKSVAECYDPHVAHLIVEAVHRLPPKPEKPPVEDKPDDTRCEHWLFDPDCPGCRGGKRP